MLLHERKCAYRSGHQSSVLNFQVGEAEIGQRRADRLARVLVKRIRSTDRAGWFDDRHIGVLLPYTDDAGARTFAHDVARLTAPEVPWLAYEVYVYPSSSDDSGRGPGPRTADAAVVVNGTMASSSPSGDEIAIASAAPVRSAGPLLVRPMPWWKRSMDVAGALAGLIVTSPLLLATAIAIKLSSRGPVVFRQQRAGRGGTPFWCYKFRTMIEHAEHMKKELRRYNEQTGPVFKVRNDPRVTWVGRILRRTSIDELPQLWNVLKGEMSLVGPRPLPCEESETCQEWYWRRLEVMPGLTCIWQVSGRCEIKFDDWVRMDIRYAENQSLWHDLKILLQTVPAVVSGTGAH